MPIKAVNLFASFTQVPAWTDNPGALLYQLLVHKCSGFSFISLLILPVALLGRCHNYISMTTKSYQSSQHPVLGWLLC